MRWAAAGLMAALTWPAGAQEPPKLDPAGVRGVRYMIRDDAWSAAIVPRRSTLLEWSAIGIARPNEDVTAAQIRDAFRGNIVQAERRFTQPFIVSGTLRAVSRRRDRQLVVSFVEGGLASEQRRALAELEPPGSRHEGEDFLSGITGGLVYAGATAVLPAVHEDAVAEWQPGHKVTLHCRGASNVPLAVLLNECAPRSAVIAEIERVADTQSDLVLARAPITVPFKEDDGTVIDPARGSRILLLIGYFAGLRGKDCPDATAGVWARCADQKVKQQPKRGQEAAFRQQMKDAVTQTARDLDIPEAVIRGAFDAPPPQRPPSGTRK